MAPKQKLTAVSRYALALCSIDQVVDLECTSNKLIGKRHFFTSFHQQCSPATLQTTRFATNCTQNVSPALIYCVIVHGWAYAPSCYKLSGNDFVDLVIRTSLDYQQLFDRAKSDPTIKSQYQVSSSQETGQMKWTGAKVFWTNNFQKLLTAMMERRYTVTPGCCNRRWQLVQQLDSLTSARSYCLS